MTWKCFRIISACWKICKCWNSFSQSEARMQRHSRWHNHSIYL